MDCPTNQDCPNAEVNLHIQTTHSNTTTAIEQISGKDKFSGNATILLHQWSYNLVIQRQFSHDWVHLHEFLLDQVHGMG